MPIPTRLLRVNIDCPDFMSDCQNSVACRSCETTWKRTYSCAKPFRTQVFHREKGPCSTQTSRGSISRFLNGGTKSFKVCCHSI